MTADPAEVCTLGASSRRESAAQERRVGASRQEPTRRRTAADKSRVGELPRLLLLTDRAQLRLGRALVRTVEQCVEAGLEAVVVREHDLTAEARHALLARLATVDGLTVISSRIVDPAAHGTHLAADQVGIDGAFGRSCHSRADVARAAAEGAAWATLSPYAPSRSKPGYGPPLPEGAYGDLPVPTYALGGITPANAAAALSAGAHGVAVMGEVMRADDPAAAVAALREQVG